MSEYLGRPLEDVAKSALQIADGASNALGISITFREALLSGYKATSANVPETLQKNPAYAPARLIAHQMMSLLLGKEVLDFEEYDRDVKACQQIVNEADQKKANKVS